MSEVETYEFLGDFIGGKFLRPETPESSWTVKSPGDLEDQVIEIHAQNDHVDRACLAARSAFQPWAELGLEKRIEHVTKLKAVMESHKEDLALAISRETGKPLWEGRTEAGALVAKINITIEHSLQLVADEKIENIQPDATGWIRYKPRGVMAVLGPFNFPMHLPNGHIVPALLTGNTIVYKPSDKTPATGQWMARMYEKAEFPPGVFNLVQGQAETGKRLVESEYIDGVLFTGSYEVGLKIKQATLHHHWKILALEMGGKNSTVVWKDADLEKAVYETIVGSFLTAGQRCSCTSKVILHRDIRDEFIENFYETAKKLVIGHWSENPFMGPLIDEDSVEKYVRFQEIAKREGAESLMRGKALSLDKEGFYVTPSINLVKEFDEKSVYQNNEIFGPNVGIYEVDDFNKAMLINNSSGFGLSMSVFSQDEELYKRAQLGARVGLLNWNRTTNGASSRLPFGGMGKSGNDRPSAHFAVNYCTVPVSSIEHSGSFDPEAVMPGVEYHYRSKS
ncbi:MAG: succinylglutamate-semialdehyde dehydrogenase [Pseudomonadota bacterium]